MDKRALLKQLEAKVASDLALLTQAALATYEGATHSESKAEDQYDTRGLEASYLAGAQSKRAMELEKLLNLVRYIDVKPFAPDSPIAATAVVELDCEGRRSYCLVMPQGGGIRVAFEGKDYQVVTPQSPLGEALLGRRVGDTVEVEIQRVTREYEIVAVS